jgi:hypothetical protein
MVTLPVTSFAWRRIASRRRIWRPSIVVLIRAPLRVGDPAVNDLCQFQKRKAMCSYAAIGGRSSALRRRTSPRSSFGRRMGGRSIRCRARCRLRKRLPTIPVTGEVIVDCVSQTADRPHHPTLPTVASQLWCVVPIIWQSCQKAEFLRVEAGAMTDGWVPLAKAVRVLRSELVDAVEAADGEDLQFTMGPVELEFELGVTNEGGTEGGVRFWVVSLGARGSRSKARHHRVKFTLTPHPAGDPAGDVNISTTGQLGG